MRTDSSARAGREEEGVRAAMTTTEADAVLAANAAFYEAMRAGDYEAMERLWTRRRQVSCTHPGRPMIRGRVGVMASWRRILLRGRPVRIDPLDPVAVVTGGSALVLCREDLGGSQMMASNAFVREAEGWRILSHQAAKIPVS